MEYTTLPHGKAFLSDWRRMSARLKQCWGTTFLFPIPFPFSFNEPGSAKDFRIKILDLVPNLQNNIFLHYSSTPWYFSKDDNEKIEIDINAGDDTEKVRASFSSKKITSCSYDRLQQLFKVKNDSPSLLDYYVFEKTSAFNCALSMWEHCQQLRSLDNIEAFIYFISNSLPVFPNTFGRINLLNSVFDYFSQNSSTISSDMLTDSFLTLQYFFEHNPYNNMKRVFWNLLMNLFFEENTNGNPAKTQMEVLTKQLETYAQATLKDTQTPYTCIQNENHSLFNQSRFHRPSRLFSFIQQQVVRSLLDMYPYENESSHFTNAEPKARLPHPTVSLSEYISQNKNTSVDPIVRATDNSVTFNVQIHRGQNGQSGQL